jgi:hypothetical protein
MYEMKRSLVGIRIVCTDCGNLSCSARCNAKVIRNLYNNRTKQRSER